MKETKIKGYHFAVVEKVTEIKTVETTEGLNRVGEKELILVEFLDEEEGRRYFEKLNKTIDPETEAVRVLADQDTAFYIQKVSDELDYHKRRFRNVPIPNPKK